jgi:FdhD protein
MNTFNTEIIRYVNSSYEKSSDRVVREEPLEIFINGDKKYFCMRMPGMDYELSVGLLFNEGLVDSLADIESWEQSPEKIFLIIKKEPSPGLKKVYSSSGSMMSDELVSPLYRSDAAITAEEIFKLQQNFFSQQQVYNETGGVHAVAFYSSRKEVVSFAEDVGRHNALDKCMGSALISGKIKDIFFIMLSSRISFEMMRKSYRTGATVVAGVSAPTSGAVIAAENIDMTLIGFLRGQNFKIYSGHQRISGIIS